MYLSVGGRLAVCPLRLLGIVPTEDVRRSFPVDFCCHFSWTGAGRNCRGARKRCLSFCFHGRGLWPRSVGKRVALTRPVAREAPLMLAACKILSEVFKYDEIDYGKPNWCGITSHKRENPSGPPCPAAPSSDSEGKWSAPPPGPLPAAPEQHLQSPLSAGCVGPHQPRDGLGSRL